MRSSPASDAPSPAPPSKPRSAHLRSADPRPDRQLARRGRRPPMKKTFAAAESRGVHRILVTGGVAANRELRQRFTAEGAGWRGLRIACSRPSRSPQTTPPWSPPPPGLATSPRTSPRIRCLPTRRSRWGAEGAAFTSFRTMRASLSLAVLVVEKNGEEGSFKPYSFLRTAEPSFVIGQDEALSSWRKDTSTLSAGIPRPGGRYIRAHSGGGCPWPRPEEW